MKKLYPFLFLVLLFGCASSPEDTEPVVPEKPKPKPVLELSQTELTFTLKEQSETITIESNYD